MCIDPGYDEIFSQRKKNFFHLMKANGLILSPITGISMLLVQMEKNNRSHKVESQPIVFNVSTKAMTLIHDKGIHPPVKKSPAECGLLYSHASLYREVSSCMSLRTESSFIIDDWIDFHSKKTLNKENVGHQPTSSFPLLGALQTFFGTLPPPAFCMIKPSTGYCHV